MSQDDWAEVQSPGVPGAELGAGLRGGAAVCVVCSASLCYGILAKSHALSVSICYFFGRHSVPPSAVSAVAVAVQRQQPCIRDVSEAAASSPPAWLPGGTELQRKPSLPVCLCL